MLEFKVKKDDQGNEWLETPYDGKIIMSIPQLNKGTAFTSEERKMFGLEGKLPPRVEKLEEQVERAYQQYLGYEKQLNRNILLNNVLNTNYILFYKLVREHIEEMLPTLYTPIVGRAVEAFNKKYSQPRGLYISFEDQDRIEEILDNRSNPEIDLIVVSDGEGVLGIGDQGVGGMAIPVAKLMVYTAFGGINPLRTLPILLDAGTNNTTLLEDPFYLGWRNPRISGEKYDLFIEKFIAAVKRKFPHVYLHWEDFGRHNAYRNLARYREKICSFNDDIQGTGVVAMAAVIAACKIAKTKLTDQRIIIFGAGTAGIGVADNLCAGIMREGLTQEEARQCFWLIDRSGLLTENTGDPTEAQAPYVRSNSEIAQWNLKAKDSITLLDVIKHVKPTILIGTSAMASAFTEEVIREMSKHVERPTIFPLSNPTERAEATPSDIIKWTKGRALLATGSPFEPVEYEGKIYPVSQCNNYLAFPGIGLGVISAKARRVHDDMLWAASVALAQFAQDDPPRLLPSILQSAETASRAVACAVAQTAIDDQLELVDPITSVEALVESNIWEPAYLPYKKSL